MARKKNRTLGRKIWDYLVFSWLFLAAIGGWAYYIGALSENAWVGWPAFLAGAWLWSWFAWNRDHGVRSHNAHAGAWGPGTAVPVATGVYEVPIMDITQRI